MTYESFERILETVMACPTHEAQMALILAVKPLILAQMQRYCPVSSEYEDLFHDGCVVVLECLRRYDPKKGRFLNLIKNYLRYYYLETFRYLSVKTARETSKDGALERIADEADVTEGLFSEETGKALREALQRLTVREREVVLYYYRDGLSHKAIGERLGLAPRTVINAKARALKKLKTELM
ncbi:sigma-70 family RNA polymerase sigma factor [Peptoniphilus equinus]|uniref:Sigma-70 family RNA polymerase sigma factor n=1 Tax=Peptoniphilus equinus TaxID=3016343 RepID=A0ABY7QSH3_9FIRM|nr:sigma-70 family RNA polymerase sigma factor [Peptoniphilus equinus]WBW49747.1 sigma-70 family RNA polymerase sigma factor [Peptoniphilus equinus]